jgi:hypothetical protein
MIKIKRPSVVSQLPQLPHEIRRALEAARQNPVFLKIREQVSQLRFPDQAKNAVAEFRRNVEVIEPADAAARQVEPVQSEALRRPAGKGKGGAKRLVIPHLTEAFASLPEERKKNPALLGAGHRTINWVVRFLRDKGYRLPAGQRRTLKRRIQELDRTSR